VRGGKSGETQEEERAQKQWENSADRT